MQIQSGAATHHHTHSYTGKRLGLKVVTAGGDVGVRPCQMVREGPCDFAGIQTYSQARYSNIDRHRVDLIVSSQSRHFTEFSFAAVSPAMLWTDPTDVPAARAGVCVETIIQVILFR